MPSLKDLRLLVVDQNPATQKILGKLFKDNGYNYVNFAPDMKAALGTMLSKPLDLILMDWKLAEQSDFFVVKKMRSTPRLADLPIMVMVTDAPRERVVAAVQAGVNNYITKPFALPTLEQRIQQTPRPKPAAAPAAGGAAPGQAPPQQAATDAQPLGPGGISAQTDANAKKLFARGFEKLQLRKFDAAIEDFKKALKHNPLFPEAHKAIAQALKSKGDRVGYPEHLQRAMETYATLERLDEAEELYKEMLKADQNTPNPFKIVADKSSGSGDSEKAARLLERAIAMNPRDESLAISLCENYKNSGSPEKASEFLKEFLDREGRSATLEELFQDITGENWYDTHSAAGEAERMAILDDIMNKKEDASAKREAARIPLADFSVIISGIDDFLSVVDISMSGLGFKHMYKPIEVGQEVTFNLIALGAIKIRDMKAIVRNKDQAKVGCQFKDLTQKQKTFLATLLPKDERARNLT